MSTISHGPVRAAREQRSWSEQLLVREMWAALAIIVMWLSVVFEAIWGPDIVSTTYLGDHTTIPSAVVVALFAFLGTWVVAKYGFQREKNE